MIKLKDLIKEPVRESLHSDIKKQGYRV